jgi:DMSO/TMAO reductase YedYZ molybdopterin-dependent catalytic subunit
MIYPSLLALKVTRSTVLVALLILVAIAGCVSPGPPAKTVPDTGQGVTLPPSATPARAARIVPSPTFTVEPRATSAPNPTHTPTPTPSATAEPTSTAPVPTASVALDPSPVEEVSPTPCVLPTVVVPTLPAKIPTYTQLDRTTGLHVTGTAQEIDLKSYRLKVIGKVDQSLSLTYDDLRCMPRIEVHCRLVCPETFVDEATWAGVPLEYVLQLAGMQSGAEGIKLISADGYAMPVPMTEVSSENNLLAYEWEGEPLPILHGFPVRAVFPESMGSRWVKWLVEIEVY